MEPWYLCLAFCAIEVGGFGLVIGYLTPREQITYALLNSMLTVDHHVVTWTIRRQRLLETLRALLVPTSFV